MRDEGSFKICHACGVADELVRCDARELRVQTRGERDHRRAREHLRRGAESEEHVRRDGRARFDDCRIALERF